MLRVDVAETLRDEKYDVSRAHETGQARPPRLSQPACQAERGGQGEPIK